MQEALPISKGELRMELMMEEMKKKQHQLHLIQEKIKHEPLVKMPFKDRDLLRFPSIMDDRKQFDKNKYIESPLINSIMNRNNRINNGESVERIASMAAKRTSIDKEMQFDSIISRFMLRNKGDRRQTQTVPFDYENLKPVTKPQKFQINHFSTSNAVQIPN